MESNFEGALAVNQKPKKENIINRIVIENFSDWRSFKNAVKGAWENVDYDPRENKFTRHNFTREILGSYASKILSDDFEKLSSLIVEEINKLERRKEKVETPRRGVSTELKSQEKDKSAEKKYVQREMPFDDRQGA